MGNRRCWPCSRLSCGRTPARSGPSGTTSGGCPTGELERFRLRHCSYIFQGYNLFPALTARQQLEVVLRWGEGVGPSEARERADHVLGQLGLASKSHLRPAQLSGGEKQRVAIARALVKNPTFVFADEPTAPSTGTTASR